MKVKAQDIPSTPPPLESGWSNTISVSIWGAGDSDGDCDVDASDFPALLAAWGLCADCDDCTSDFDGDCDVDASDFLALLAGWGTYC